MLGEAGEVRLVKRVLRVEQHKHLPEERREEVVERVEQIDVLALVVGAEVMEEVGEDVRVLLVEQPVRLDEHVVQVALRIVQQLSEERCNGKREAAGAGDGEREEAGIRNREREAAGTRNGKREEAEAGNS